MYDLPERTSGERLAGDAYWARFQDDFWRAGPPGVWKLERLQTFQEPEDESWRALDRGDWTTALRLIEDRDADLHPEFQKMADLGIQLYRVRVADRPITPYLQWEFHIFRQRQRAGENIHVIGSGQIGHYEKNSVFPEIVTVGTDVMYEIWYDETGVQQGGIRFADRNLTSRYQEIIQDIYSTGEELENFFAREIAVLEAPIGA
jgi:hypothetical protein